MLAFFIMRLFGKKSTADAASVVPKHIAFIMDGNRRWAKKRGKPTLFGHQKGAEAIEPVTRHLFARGVETISLYAFSIENWERSKEEVDYLMKFITSEMPKHIKRAMAENIRLKFIGRRNVLSAKIVKMFESAERDTAENTAGTIVFAIDYSGKDEIIRAVNDMVGGAFPKPRTEITEELFESYMDTGDLSPVDLVVRTSGEERISNFMLWKLAYAELMFIPEDWPAMNAKIADRILGEFSKRSRRFGK